MSIETCVITYGDTPNFRVTAKVFPAPNTNIKDIKVFRWWNNIIEVTWTTTIHKGTVNEYIFGCQNTNTRT